MSASWSRVTAALAVGTLVLSGLLLAPRPAAADTQPPVPTTPATVSTDPLPTVQINGVVWAQIVVGNTVYATGQFTQARPAGAAPGTNQTPRSNILAYNITNGQLVTGFAPTLNAQGLALVASPDGQTIYVGGDFTQVNGQNKYRLAALDATTGALRNFTPGMDARVRALAVNGSTLYVGGIFGIAANQPRTRLAAFNTATSQLLPWAPTADAEVSTLAVHPGTNRVFVGGKFGTVNGQVYRGVGALDGTSGAVLPFPLNTVAVNSGIAAGYYGLKVAGDVVYGAGWSFNGAQGNFENVFAVNATTAQTIWLSGCRGDTYDTQPLGDVVYFVSHAHNCTSIGAFPETGGGNQQRGAAYRLAAVPGKVNSGIFPGQPAPELLHWFPTLAAGSYTGQTQAAWSVTGNAQYIALGGEFPTINNSVAQQGLVRYAVRTTAPNDDGPQGFSTITPTLTGIGGGAVRAAFTAAWDRDNTRLTYDLMRGATFESAVVAASTTADTNFWTRPAMTLTDASAPAGSQTYRIRVTDPLGNVMVGQTAVINVTAGAGQTPYQARVAQDGAVNQWTLGEASGSTAFDRRGSRDLTLPGGAQRNQVSALAGQTDPSTVFPGNANAGTAGAAAAGPQTFSVEAWFRAGPGTRGKIIGFGNAATGSSGSYDRHLYMNNAGNLVFGVNDGAVKVVTSPNAYTDGGFHHAVGTFTANQVRLFVDGVLVGSRNDAPAALQYNGFWRVGGDNLAGWPTTPSGSSWNNLLDEVAVYPTALSAQTVLEHYNLGRGTPLNQAPTASFTATPNDLTVALNAAGSTDQDGTIAGYAWNLGDGQTGTGVSTQHTYAAAGSYTVTLTVTDDDNATGTTTRPVTVTAPPAGAVTVAADAFDRTVAAGLGTADTGGAWTVAGAGTTTSVTGGAGRLGLPVGRTATMRLNSVATQDTDMTSTLWSETMPTGGGLYLGQSVRVGAGNEYLGRVRIMSSGVVQVSINRVVGGTETTIGASVNVAGLTYTAGQQLRFRTQAIGTAPTTVRVKVWPAGAAEPAAFQQSATDTTTGLQGPGAVGLYSYLSSSATAAGVVRFDDLTAVRPAAG